MRQKKECTFFVSLFCFALLCFFFLHLLDLNLKLLKTQTNITQITCKCRAKAKTMSFGSQLEVLTILVVCFFLVVVFIFAKLQLTWFDFTLCFFSLFFKPSKKKKERKNTKLTWRMARAREQVAQFVGRRRCRKMFLLRTKFNK